jgi:protein-tyrosine phosphatase
MEAGVFQSILMVCVGNICRSPMAEALARKLLPSVHVESAGLGALVGKPADPLAQELLRERGLDLSAHRARQLTPDMLRAFELILVMEAWQVREVERQVPGARGRVFRIGHWGGFEVGDPYRQPRAAFERALADIERGLSDLLRVLSPR